MRALTMDEVEYVSGGREDEVVIVWGHLFGGSGGLSGGSSGTAGGEGGGTNYANNKFNIDININLDINKLLEQLAAVYNNAVSKSNNSVANAIYNTLNNKQVSVDGNTVTTRGKSPDGHWYFLDDVGHDRDWDAIRRFDPKTGLQEIWANGGWHPYGYN